MTIVALKDLKSALPKGRRLLGIDQSKKALGLALATPDFGMATPLKTIARVKFTEDAKVLANVCREYEVGGFVIGLPLNMDGSEGPRVESVKHFADNLIKAKDVLGFEPVIAFFDERLTTSAVEDLLDEHSRLSREERNKVVDKLAAQIILQGALDMIARGGV